MIDDNTQKYIDTATEQIKTSIDYHYDQLVQKPSKDLATLPENIFVQYFLPFFCGEKEIEKDNDVIARWIAVAGNPIKEVNVIDDDNKIIFTVPALVDSTFIDFKNINKGQPFKNIIANYELHKSQLPIVGENYLRNQIDVRIESLTRNSTVQETNEKRWVDIFTRYNKIESSEKDVQLTDRLSDDEISYD
jgi:hypothetical protein